MILRVPGSSIYGMALTGQPANESWCSVNCILIIFVNSTLVRKYFKLLIVVIV